jgi:hypothetical protein
LPQYRSSSTYYKGGIISLTAGICRCRNARDVSCSSLLFGDAVGPTRENHEE